MRKFHLTYALTDKYQWRAISVNQAYLAYEYLLLRGCYLVEFGQITLLSVEYS